MDPELSGVRFNGLGGKRFALALDDDCAVVGSPWDSKVSNAVSIEIFSMVDQAYKVKGQTF